MLLLFTALNFGWSIHPADGDCSRDFPWSSFPPLPVPSSDNPVMVTGEENSYAELLASLFGESKGNMENMEEEEMERMEKYQIEIPASDTTPSIPPAVHIGNTCAVRCEHSEVKEGCVDRCECQEFCVQAKERDRCERRCLQVRMK